MAKRKSKSGSLFDGDADVVDTTPPGGGEPEGVPLHEAAQARYLNYALSVITSRALPDVRDGLKPVQRRILYTMWQQNLTADAKHRKCAKVVGDVMGNYHPHGDSALYETLVRMAQSFSLRYPTVDGSGNFGSLDGDPAAAMRYTECRLARISDEMLREIDQATVAFRPNYDGTRTEPVVLPARIPNLLVNGATGIAVGMATNIPPHNLGEVCTALVKLLDNPDLTAVQLCRYVKAPDFPTGGQILNSSEELKEIYKTGSGAIRLRGTWEEGPTSKGSKIIYITSIPYTINKATLVEQIGQVAASRKLPPLLDVKDVSTDDVRILLELKKESDEKMVMAYLFKHTMLQTSFVVNLTCLEPTEGNVDVGRPKRMDLHEILWHFLHFRLDVVTRRLEHELEALKKRIHILEGFEKVFDALDEILKIVRKSEGKAGCGRADHQALCARRRPDRRDPRAEDLPPRAARDPDHPQGARGEAPPRPPDHHAAQGRAEPLGHRQGRDRGDSEEIRRCAPLDDRQRRGRSGIHRRRLHRRGRQRRDRLARRLGEAAEGSEGRRDDEAARGGRGAGGAAWQHAGVGGVLQQLRRRLLGAYHRHPGVDRLRRADSAVLQAEGRRAHRRGAAAWIRGSAGEIEAKKEGAEPPVHAVAVVERRLQPALQPAAVRRAEHARRAPLREGGREGGVRRRGARGGRRDRSSPRRARRTRCCARSRRSASCRVLAAASS